jgi:hypothetical protein
LVGSRIGGKHQKALKGKPSFASSGKEEGSRTPQIT